MVLIKRFPTILVYYQMYHKHKVYAIRAELQPIRRSYSSQAAEIINKPAALSVLISVCVYTQEEKYYE